MPSGSLCRTTNGHIFLTSSFTPIIKDDNIYFRIGTSILQHLTTVLNTRCHAVDSYTLH